MKPTNRVCPEYVLPFDGCGCLRCLYPRADHAPPPLSRAVWRRESA